MKVRVAYTVEVDDDFRRAVRAFYGQPGLATRAELKDWFRDYGRSQDDDVMWELQERERRKAVS